MFYLCDLHNIEEYFKSNSPFVLKHEFGLSNIVGESVLINLYGKLPVAVPEIIEGDRVLNLGEMSQIKVSLSEYVEKYIDLGSYYLRFEKPFGFVGFDYIMKALRKKVAPLYPFGKMRGISIWWGGAGSITPLHYDSYGIKVDAFLKENYKENFYKNPRSYSLLTVVSGVKEVTLISPEYNGLIKQDNLGQSGAMYASESFSKVMSTKGLKTEKVILKTGESLSIPKFWWHRVNNLKKGLSLTYNFKL